MADFAVEIEGVTVTGPRHPENHEGCQGRWVLAVDPIGDRLLIPYEDKTLHWHDMADCKFRTMADPVGVTPVVVVKPGPDPLSALTLPPTGPNGGGP